MILLRNHGRVRNEGVIPNAEENKKFWSEIWSAKKEHNKVECIGNIWNELENGKQRVMTVPTKLI